MKNIDTYSITMNNNRRSFLFRFLCSISIIMKLKNDPHFHIYVVSSILYCKETKKVTKIWQTFSFFTITVDHFQTIVSFVLIFSFIDQKITSIAIETFKFCNTLSPKWFSINNQTNCSSSISCYLQRCIKYLIVLLREKIHSKWNSRWFYSLSLLWL